MFFEKGSGWAELSSSSDYLSVPGVKNEVVTGRGCRNLLQLAFGFFKCFHGFDPHGLAIRQAHKDVKFKAQWSGTSAVLLIFNREIGKTGSIQDSN
jgi:hypothetical protein